MSFFPLLLHWYLMEPLDTVRGGMEPESEKSLNHSLPVSFILLSYKMKFFSFARFPQGELSQPPPRLELPPSWLPAAGWGTDLNFLLIFIVLLGDL